MDRKIFGLVVEDGIYTQPSLGLSRNKILQVTERYYTIIAVIVTS